ncbi:DUF916 domain-containing protein [Salinibacterium sp. ZJ454]|uniref:DUF916 domain-containing protein n=1 Tax=Salinibacterium sp. ZJ454 TaxID=2708339 RepID=UPI0014249E7A|nr:DUF916 domain-containing protein [Salinibacterium sp. ZJ454]
MTTPTAAARPMSRVPRRSRSARRALIAPTAALALLGALVLPTLAPAAHAEDGDVTWGVQPGSSAGPDGREAFDYQVAPGTVVSDWVSVTNSSTTEISVRMLAEDATTDYDTGAFTLVGADIPSTTVGGWTSLNGAPATCPDTTPEQTAACLPTLGIQLSLAPGERANIPFTLTVPHDASPGDHAGGIAAIVTTQTGGGDGINTPIEVHAGTRIYLRVDGPLSPGMTATGLVSGYDPSWNPFVGGTGRLGFDLVNDGNIRITAEPTVTLTGPFGIGLGEFSLPEVANIMPGQSAHVAAELPGVPPLLMLFSDVSITPVLADGVAAANDTMPETVQVSTTAWAMPWVWLLIVVVVGGGPALVLWWRRRTRHALADDLAAYTERIRAEERARPDHPDAATHPHDQADGQPRASRYVPDYDESVNDAAEYEEIRGSR